jgi:DNA-binding IscR family transcriptional regulator
LTVGEIVRLMEGPIRPVKCVSGNEVCPFRGDCPFMEMWDKAADAMQKVFDDTSIQSLLDKQASMAAAALADPTDRPCP